MFFKGFTLGYIVCIIYVPYLPYTNVVWTPSSVQHFKRLKRLHLKFNIPTSNTNLSKCVTLTEQRYFHTAIQYYVHYHHLI